ncbi:MAG: ATP-binding protein [Gallionella sp.]|jgi:signal transduction histidine kinase/DNA-binding response OmpR family regulator
MKVRDQLPQRLLLAMVPPLVALALQWIFWAAIEPYAWFLFFPAVFVSAWIGGLVPGLMSTFISALAVRWFFIQPQFSFGGETPMSLVSIGVFLVMGILFSISQARRLKAIKQADDANAASLSSKERYRMLFESMDEGFCVIKMLYDPDGKPNDYRFVEINPAFEQQSGLHDAQGKTIRQLVPDQDGSWYEIFGKVVETGEPIRFDNPSPAVQRHFDVFASRIGGAGSRIVGILFRDVTARELAERNLVAAKEAAELANRAKDSFLATMSHEIRTPLTGMLGMLELLSMTQLDQDQHKTLDAAWDSGRGLLRIVSDILDWSKIEDGKLELSPRPTSIPLLLQDVVNTYSRVASAKSLMLGQHVDARLTAAYIVDPLRLSQVLNNFVSNAIKFTQQGEIELRAELLSHLDSGDRIRFSVRDTGIGIAAEAQERLFQRYRQESADTARMYGGTGLGLAICRRLAEMMDGQIELQSEYGCGSVFSITLILPLSGAPAEVVEGTHLEVKQREVKPLIVGDSEAPLVLAVDDHPINRDLLGRQIRLLGLRAETAENGEVALSMWREGRFALVITDCHMPEMDGYEFARKARRIETEESRSRTPIIAWTANALAEEAGRCDAAGMDDLLVKPANLAQLRATLAKWLSITEADEESPASPPHAGEPIDYAVLNTVVADSAAHPQVLEDFLSHIRADHLKLSAMFAQGDRDNLERTAHRMKGSSRMVGAKSLAASCEAIEHAARGDDMAKARSAKAALDEALDELATYLTAASKPGGSQ